jgi:rubrerythrin
MDILVYAIKMELDGEKFYREQAANNKNSRLKGIFSTLADDEADHARVLENKSKGLQYQLNAHVSVSLKNVFAGVPADFGSEKPSPDQLDVYRLALEKEKESISLYQKLLAEATDGKDLYRYLIAEEEEHMRLLNEILEHVNRPNTWVEAAEFGNRKEY